MARTYETVSRMVEQPQWRANNYRVVKNCLAQLTPFTHSTMSAEWLPSGQGYVYTVFSYSTQVAWVYDFNTETRENGEVGGVTTSKHLGYCRAWLPADGWAVRVKEAQR